MNAVSRFRQDLKSGRVLLGPAISFADPLVSDALGDSVDFLWIDMEHNLLDPAAVAGHLLAARARNVPGLVRVRGSATPFIKPALDAGADGIIVPQVRSAEEVRQVVGDCRYPPLGRRGFGPRVPSNYGRDSGADFVARANQELFVSVQIETVEAVEAIDEIVAIPGLDSVCFGPWDLSGSLGVLGQVEHPTVVAAIERVIARARAVGMPVGTGMGADPEYAAVMARRGCSWIQLGGDHEYLVKYMDQLRAGVRRHLGEAVRE